MSTDTFLNNALKMQRKLSPKQLYYAQINYKLGITQRQADD
jgi:hypothetical protein